MPFSMNMKRLCDKMSLTWLNNGFICQELYAPFKINKDIEYRTDLEKKYDIVMKQAKKVNADDESLKIIETFGAKILNSLGHHRTNPIDWKM